MLESIGYDGDTETVTFAVTHCKAYAVNSNRAFFYRYVALGDERGIDFILKFEVSAAVKLIDIDTSCSSFNMSLYNMTVKAPVH